LLAGYHASVNFSDTGFDKAIAEAMACGMPVLSTNACFAELVPDDLRDLLVLDHDDVTEQARRITRLLELDELERRDVGERLRAIIDEHHGLAQFWGKILSEIERSTSRSVRHGEVRRGTLR
jgi:glycosyltransferase involved in cell wall biosynthesis